MKDVKKLLKELKEKLDELEEVYFSDELSEEDEDRIEIFLKKNYERGW